MFGVKMETILIVGVGEGLVIPEEGKHLNSFTQIVGIKSQTSRPIFFFFHVQYVSKISDPQNSCRGYEMLNKGQRSSREKYFFHFFC